MNEFGIKFSRELFPMHNRVNVAVFAAALISTVTTPYQICNDASQSQVVLSKQIASNYGNSMESGNLVIDLLKLENLKNIELMATFEDNWNGVGGHKFTSDSISIFREIIANVSKQPQIAPTGRNSLYMEYRLNDGDLLAYELSTDKLEEVFVPQGDYSKAKTEIYSCDFLQNIDKRVKIFYGLGEN